VCLESSQDFEGGGDDSNCAIVASKEEALGAGADTAYLISIEEGLALVVWRLDLADFEEIEGLPLLL
jgi:hypothetical protein